MTKSQLPTIESEADLKAGIEYLTSSEPRFAKAYDLTGLPPLRRQSGGFRTLLDMIVSQQVSVAAADAIWKRVETAGFTDPARVLQSTEDELRSCGLSRQKARYVRALAECGLDYERLRGCDDNQVISCLTEIKGIGKWTAEIYAMSALGRPDVFAAGDLALQESTRLLFGLDERPSEAQLRKMAARWSPWRAVAARLLWAYYREIKDREGIR